jgi:membrane protein implicated in regulation of membrane protease activity
MWFRSYTNILAQASRTLALSILTVGLILIGFGAVIAAFPEVFAYLAAAVFFVVGLSLALAALKMLWAQRRMNRQSRDSSDLYRRNVRIHTQDPSDPFGL